MSRTASIVLISLVGFIPSAADAKPGIVCDGSFQIVQGQPVSTPFCQEAQLASSLQKRGVNISAEAIRHSPEAKRQACAAAHGDTSVLACAEENY